jgi:hypothetical protein
VTLWHEMAHVFTLQLSDQRIPRWLTEGISVFEEKRARPEWGREMDIPFARALDRGQVLPLKDLNSGFSNPETISLSYFQSSLVVDHIVEVYGQPKLKALVQSYATGIDTEAAIRQVRRSYRTPPGPTARRRRSPRSRSLAVTRRGPSKRSTR